MELYHQTLLKPSVASIALSAHLLSTSPKEELDKHKQLCLCRNSSIELFHLQTSKIDKKYEFKSFHYEELFSNICAADVIIYQDQELRSDILIITLANGKYQLLEWRKNSSRFALIDQNMIFNEEIAVMSGLAKPTPGHYVAVNNEADFVMIASANWEFKLYVRGISIAGIRLTPLLAFQQPIQSPSICLQLISGLGQSTLFYSMRVTLGEDGIRRKRVHRMLKNQNKFQQQIINIDDLTVKMLIARANDNGYIMICDSNIHYTSKNKLQSISYVQQKPGLPVSYWRRPIRERKEQIFLLNEHGEIRLLTLDDIVSSNNTVVYVETIEQSTQIAVLQKNTFFALGACSDSFVFQFNSKFKFQDKIQKTRSSKVNREEQIKPLKELEVMGILNNSNRQIRDMKIGNLQKAMNNQLMITGGRIGAKKGFLNILKYGLKIQNVSMINVLVPSGIWSIKKHVSNQFHSYIVISFQSRKTFTYQLQNKKKFNQTSELKLQEQQYTLNVARLADNSLIQMMASRIRCISKDGYIKDTSVKGRIMKAISVNEGRQLAGSLIGGFLVYYQLVNGQIKQIKQFTLDSEASQLDFAPPEFIDGKLTSKILVIGKNNYYITVYSINQGKIQQTFTKNIKATIESVVVVPDTNGSYIINVGTTTGRVIKILITVKGLQISSSDTQIGQKAVKMGRLTVLNHYSVIQISPSPTVSYYNQGQIVQCSLSLPVVELISQIKIEGLEGSTFVTYFDGYLQIVSMTGFQNLLHQVQKQLQLPGRKLVIIEDRLGVLMQAKILKQEQQIWISKFLVLDPQNNYAVQKSIGFGQNQKCTSACFVQREDKKNYLCFGCVFDLSHYPTLSYHQPSIKIFSYEKQDKTINLNLIYTHNLDEIPTAMEVFDDKLLVGSGKRLKLYELTKNKLVLKAEQSGLNSPISQICTQGQKIFTAQTMNSFTLLRHNPLSKTFEYVGEDILPRFISTAHLIDGDYGVIAGGDKFGNFFISKLSQKIKVQFYSQNNQNAYNQFTDISKFDSLIGYNLGQIVTAIQSGRIDGRKSQTIFYATSDGRIGMFYPFETQQALQHGLMTNLQVEMRKTNLPGSSNQKQYRSFFTPSRGVIDGDFCNLFQSLSQPQKLKISTNLGKDAREVGQLLTYMQSKFT